MILFLDYDGVLHPNDAYLVRGRPVLRAEGALFMWASPLAALLDAHPQVQIVLSTSWARELGFTRARRFLPDTLRARVIGATWHSAMAFTSNGDYRPRDRDTWWDRATRHQQIRRYVDRARLADWIAVDDDSEGWADADRDRLVLASPNRGLGDAATMARLRELLTAASWAGPVAAQASVAVLHAVYSLADYPVLASIAAKRTQARKLDGRACLHLYKSALGDIDWLTITPREKEFMRRLGIFSICPSCGAQALERDTRDHTMTRPDGQEITVPNLSGDYCNACGEVILDAAEGQRIADAYRQQGVANESCKTAQMDASTANICGASCQNAKRRQGK